MQVRLRSVDDQVAGRLASALRVKAATARCLVARGILEPKDAQGFIDPRLAALRPPSGLAGLPLAVSRIADAIQRGERIGVFGDYDVDGVTSAALLTTFFRATGATVEVAVARRDAGYGFTVGAAADFAARGCRIVVTCDCGTSDLDAIAAAASHGIEVIVVDHHTVPSADRPHPSLSLVNPYRTDSTFPFRGMASVGLTFYVAAAVRTELRDRGYFSREGRAEPDVRELLDFVALGTIADLVPLASENRILTSLGLRRLASRARPGIAALLDVSGVNVERDVDAHMVAWKLAPRINAPGRLGAAEPSLALLLADGETAAAKAQALEEANQERRAIQDRVMKEALEKLGMAPTAVDDAGMSMPGMRLSAATGEWDGPAIVIAGEGWPTGVVGIVAAKLVDKFRRPAFVIGIDPVTGLGRGSARTCNGVNLYAALREAAGTLTADGVEGLGRYGGHAAAAGFAIQRGAIAPFAEALAASCGKLAAGSGPTPTGREIDAEVRLAEVDERLAAELAGLGPFGQENPAPLLLTRNARVSSVRRVGNDRHLKLTLEDDRGTIRGAIGFGLGAREVEVGANVDMAFLPTVSTYQGRRSAEMEIADFALTAT